MKRDNIDLSVTPPDLREAEALLIRYGLWAQDRYKKRRCASAEGQYRAPPTPGEEPMPELMADFAAMDVQRALQVVPSSGQCAYPSDLDWPSISPLLDLSSGQCAYPSDLDWRQWRWP